MNTTLKFLSGFLFGSIAGAAAAILLAPMRGDELREKIQSEAGRIQNEVQQAAANRRSDLEQQLATLRTPRKPMEY